MCKCKELKEFEDHNGLVSTPTHISEYVLAFACVTAILTFAFIAVMACIR